MSKPTLPPIFLQTVQAGGGYDQLVKDHEVRHQAYCGRHNYQYVYWEQENFSPYTKFRWAQKWFKRGHSHVFLFDADALVIDLSRDMRETTKGASIAMVQYPNPFYEYPVQYNAGIIYLRNTPEVRSLLEAILEGDGKWSEQHQLNHLFFDEGPWQFKCNALPFRWNAQVITRSAPGDIVAGFHGMNHNGVPYLRKEMREFAARFPIE